MRREPLPLDGPDADLAAVLVTRCLPPMIEAAGLRGEFGWLLAEVGISERALIERLLLVRDAAQLAAAEAWSRCDGPRARKIERIVVIAGQLGLYMGMRGDDPQVVAPCLERALALLIAEGTEVASAIGRPLETPWQPVPAPAWTGLVGAARAMTALLRRLVAVRAPAG